jgi:hypothetical protein
MDARNAYMLSENPRERKNFRDQAIHAWENDIKLILEKLSLNMLILMKWTQGRCYWQAFLNVIMNLPVP